MKRKNNLLVALLAIMLLYCTNETLSMKKRFKSMNMENTNEIGGMDLKSVLLKEGNRKSDQETQINFGSNAINQDGGRLRSIHSYEYKEENSELQLNKEEFVLIELEKNKHERGVDLDRAHLVRTAFKVNGVTGDYFESENMKTMRWTDDELLTEIKGYFRKKNKDYKKATTETILKALPKIFHVKVDIYNSNRYRDYATKNDAVNTIYIKESMKTLKFVKHEDQFYILRDLTQLKREFPNLFPNGGNPYGIEFSPLTVDQRELKNNLDLNAEYEDLNHAIYEYNVDTDVREKDGDILTQIEKIQTNMRNEAEDNWKNTHQKFLNVIQNKNKTIKMPAFKRIDRKYGHDGGNVALERDIQFKVDLYTLAQFVDVYIKEQEWETWTYSKQADVMDKILENSRTYNTVSGAFERVKDESLINFFLWYQVDVFLNIKDVMRESKSHKGFMFNLNVGSLLGLVIPFCCRWKSLYTDLNPNLPYYEWMLPNIIMADVAIWSMYNFGYFEYGNVLLPSKSHVVSAVNDEMLRQLAEEEPGFFTKHYREIKKNYPRSIECFDTHILSKDIRKLIGKGWHGLHAFITGDNLNFGQLFAITLVINYLTFYILSQLEMYGLHLIFEPGMKWYMLLFNVLKYCKVTAFIVGPPQSNWGEYAVTSWFNDPHGEWLEAKTWNNYMVHLIVILNTTWIVVSAKLWKCASMNAGHFIANCRFCKCLTNFWKTWVCTKHHNSQGYWEHIGNNWKPILSRFLAVVSLVGLKYGIAATDVNKEFFLLDFLSDVYGILGLIWMWTFVEGFRHLFFKHYQSISEIKYLTRRKQILDKKENLGQLNDSSINEYDIQDLADAQKYWKSKFTIPKKGEITIKTPKCLFNSKTVWYGSVGFMMWLSTKYFEINQFVPVGWSEGEAYEKYEQESGNGEQNPFEANILKVVPNWFLSLQFLGEFGGEGMMFWFFVMMGLQLLWSLKGVIQNKLSNDKWPKSQFNLDD